MTKLNKTISATHKITQRHYTPRVKSEYENHEILDWGDKDAQFKRFEILSQNVDLKSKTLLDIGCGLGDLYRHLSKTGNLPLSYTGSDIVEAMINLAKEQQPECSFICSDVFSHPPTEKFDVIYCSGIFNLHTENNLEYLEYVTENCQNLTSDSPTIVFNFLHHRTPKKYDHCFYYDPEQVVKILKKHFSDITLIDDYLINDFTIIAKK